MTMHDETMRELRRALRDLHRTLLQAERIQYERAFGRLETEFQALFLAMDDPQFAWLRPLAKLVVELDERAMSKDFGDGDRAWAMDEVRALLVPNAAGTLFQRLYHDALQRGPEVVMAHAAVMRALPKAPATA